MCCGIVLSVPVLLFGFPYPTHDSQIHEVWYSSFATQLWAGDWYPRWLQNLDGGLGGPTFYFYPPVPFFITAIFQPFLHGASQAWRALGFSAALALVSSGVFAYAWLKQTATARSASIAAILYMAMPYHFAVDLHTRGAFGEVWSFVWIPLILYFVQKIVQRERFATLGLSVSYALLIATHLPTTLILSLIPPAYSWWISERRERVLAAARTSCGMALGIGLASIYLLPAMMDQSSVSMEAMRTGDFYYANVFFLRWSARDGFALARHGDQTLFWVMLVTAGVGVCAWLLARRSESPRVHREMAFWAVVGLLAVGLTLSVSKPVYELIPPLQLIQFPWRFNVVLVTAVAPMVAMGLSAVTKPIPEPIVRTLVVGGLLVFQCALFALQPLLNTSFGANAQLTGPTSVRGMNDLNTSEYRPRWAHTEVRRLLASLRADSSGIARARVIGDSGRLAVSQWKPRDIGILVDGRTRMMVEVRQYYYPGWTATLDGSEHVTVEPSSEDGLIRIPVPPGIHAIELHLANSAAERWGEIVSAASVAVLILTAILVAVVGFRSASSVADSAPVAVPIAGLPGLPDA